MSQLSQEGKTRYTHYSIAYHLERIPKYRRKILVADVEAETKRLIVECCQRHQLKLLALETDLDHVHVFVFAPKVSQAQKDLWKRLALDFGLLRWYGRSGVC